VRWQIASRIAELTPSVSLHRKYREDQSSLVFENYLAAAMAPNRKEKDKIKIQ